MKNLIWALNVYVSYVRKFFSKIDGLGRFINIALF